MWSKLRIGLFRREVIWAYHEIANMSVGWKDKRVDQTSDDIDWRRFVCEGCQVDSEG